jgi:hypothetical protein
MAKAMTRQWVAKETDQSCKKDGLSKDEVAQNQQHVQVMAYPTVSEVGRNQICGTHDGRAAV